MRTAVTVVSALLVGFALAIETRAQQPAAPLRAAAQPGATMRQVGYLSPGPGYPFEAFRDGLQELGYVEGSNITIERRSAEGRPERLQALAADLVQLHVDVIVTATTAATQAAQRATTTIPIVFALADEPVELGLIASVAKPGGNITGLTGLMAELTAKRLELLKELSPRVKRVAVLWGPYPFSAPVLKEVESAGRTLGLTLHEIEVREPTELDSAFARMTAWRAEALLVLPHPMFVAQRTHLAELAAKHRLPSTYHLKEFVEVGGLMSYAPDMADMSRRAAGYVDKILKGAKPGELPVEQPTKFELAINLKTAKALGLKVPQSLLLQADKLIR
jgi:putative ABC transport system substrate-binding protein